VPRGPRAVFFFLTLLRLARVIWTTQPANAATRLWATEIVAGKRWLRLVLSAVVCAFVFADAGVAMATPPGQNGRIAFSSYGTIFTVRQDGSGLEQVVRAGEEDKLNYQPSWSPQGGWLVTMGAIEEPDGWSEHDLVVLGLPSSTFWRINTPNQHWSTDPAWSPDGSRIAFVSDRADSPGIHTIAPDGSDLRFLGPGSEPDWSPDGSRIVFSRSVGDDDHGDLYTMRADGSDVRRLLSSSALETRPSWSPDGKTIVFERKTVRAAEGGGYFLGPPNIFAVPASGGPTIQLTETGADQDPAWAPDGKSIVFESERDVSGTGQARADLYLMRPDGTGQRRLTSIGCLGCAAAWESLPLPPQQPAPQVPPPSDTPNPNAKRSPRVTKLRVKPRRFSWAARRPVTVTLTLSAPADLRIEIQPIGTNRLKARCRHTRSCGARRPTRRGHTGINRFRLRGMLSRPLAPGRYRISIKLKGRTTGPSTTIRVKPSRRR
jgi:hypothetical protein